MQLPTNTTINLPFLATNKGGYNLFINRLDTTATVLGPPPLVTVAGLTDLNGDLAPDVIVGIPGDDETTTNAGRVYVSFGFSATVPNATLAGDTTRLITAAPCIANGREGVNALITRWNASPSIPACQRRCPRLPATSRTRSPMHWAA